MWHIGPTVDQKGSLLGIRAIWKLIKMSLRVSCQSYPSDTYSPKQVSQPYLTFWGGISHPKCLGKLGVFPGYILRSCTYCVMGNLQPLNLYILDTGAEKMLMRVCMESTRKEKAMLPLLTGSTQHSSDHPISGNKEKPHIPFLAQQFIHQRMCSQELP